MRSQAVEVEDLRVTEPVEADPRGTRPPANGAPQKLFNNPVRFGSEGLFCRRKAGIRPLKKSCLTSRCDIGRFRQRSRTFPDDFNLPVDLFFIEGLNTLARTIEPGARRDTNGTSARIVDLILIAGRDEMRDVQREQR